MKQINRLSDQAFAELRKLPEVKDSIQCHEDLIFWGTHWGDGDRFVFWVQENLNPKQKQWVAQQLKKIVGEVN